MDLQVFLEATDKNLTAGGSWHDTRRITGSKETTRRKGQKSFIVSKRQRVV